MNFRAAQEFKVLERMVEGLRKLDFQILEYLRYASQRLQVLRAIIYNEIVRIDPELKENQPKMYRK